MKKPLIVLALGLCLLALSGSLYAQTKLAPSATAPKVDGVISDKEYAYLSAGSGITLGLALSADGQTLYAALSAPTSAWVSIGMGSLRMNKSFMVMGYDDGKSNVQEMYGINKGHNPANQKLMTAGVAKKNGALTTLEFSLPAESFTKGGKLDLILAYGTKADFLSMHKWKTAFSVPVGK